MEFRTFRTKHTSMALLAGLGLWSVYLVTGAGCVPRYPHQSGSTWLPQGSDVFFGKSFEFDNQQPPDPGRVISDRGFSFSRTFSRACSS